MSRRPSTGLNVLGLAADLRSTRSPPIHVSNLAYPTPHPATKLRDQNHSFLRMLVPGNGCNNAEAHSDEPRSSQSSYLQILLHGVVGKVLGGHAPEELPQRRRRLGGNLLPPDTSPWSSGESSWGPRSRRAPATGTSTRGRPVPSSASPGERCRSSKNSWCSSIWEEFLCCWGGGGMVACGMGKSIPRLREGEIVPNENIHLSI